MKFPSIIIVLLSIVCLFNCATSDDNSTNSNIASNPDTDTPVTVTPENIPKPDGLVSLSGTQILDAQGNPMLLQGVAFGNEVWRNPTSAPQNHHSEIDYQRVSTMGMNAVRFYLNYQLFESDSNPYVYRQEGWDWLDTNIAWAKRYGVYLILNMHAPQGGYQSQGNGDALWDNPENQDRLIALWKAIAERYKEEGQIIGFGPVNEPVPSQSMSQWTALAQRLINEIQSVNPHHLLFIEKAIYVKGNFEVDANLNFPEVEGNNIVYEFHGYDPHRYTHQLMNFSGLPDGGKYPDDTILEVANGSWETATFGNPSIPAQNSDWTYFEGEKYQISDPEIDYVLPALIGARVNGRVYFDDLVINEFDQNGNFVRAISDLNLNTLDNWYYWSSNNSGSSGLANLGHNDTNSLFIEGSTDDCNLSNPALRFIPTLNHQYQISGWMQGENVAANANCHFRLDMYSAEGEVRQRNKDYLRYEIEKFTTWAQQKNAALYMGEFGTGYPSFQNNKGGATYVEDLLDLAIEYNIHFTYHTYHEDNFGIYRGHQRPDPSNVNQALIDLFTRKLN